MLLGQRFEDALVFAARLHAGDIRKGTCIPYLAHLLGTASIALEHAATEDEAIAALLHGAVEDHGREQLVTIRERFGDPVAAIVVGCSDSDVTPKLPWRIRKEAYVVAALPVTSEARHLAEGRRCRGGRGVRRREDHVRRRVDRGELRHRALARRVVTRRGTEIPLDYRLQEHRL